MVPTGNII